MKKRANKHRGGLFVEAHLVWENGEPFVDKVNYAVSPVSDDIVFALERHFKAMALSRRIDKSLAPHVEMVIRNGGADLLKSGVQQAVSAILDRFGKPR